MSVATCLCLKFCDKCRQPLPLPCTDNTVICSFCRASWTIYRRASPLTTAERQGRIREMLDLLTGRLLMLPHHPGCRVWGTARNELKEDGVAKPVQCCCALEEAEKLVRLALLEIGEPW